jgi:hypothetical protein
MIASPGWTILKDESGDEFGAKKMVVVCSEYPELEGKSACVISNTTEILSDKGEILYAVKNENIACYE